VNYIHIPTCDHINYLGKGKKKHGEDIEKYWFFWAYLLECH
jgi:hypothetical protein